jgi:hypothetical protein
MQPAQPPQVVRYAFRSDLRELKRPHLADEVTAEGMVRGFADQAEPRRLIDAARGDQDVIGPKSKFPVAKFARARLPSVRGRLCPRSISAPKIRAWSKRQRFRRVAPQSARQAGVSLRLRRRASQPSPAKPVSVIAQVEGSGAATKSIDK